MATDDLVSTGIILLVVITIAYGGTFLLKVGRGDVPVNDLQRTFFRAGHAHAGVLVILGLVVRFCLQHPAVPPGAPSSPTSCSTRRSSCRLGSSSPSSAVTLSDRIAGSPCSGWVPPAPPSASPAPAWV